MQKTLFVIRIFFFLLCVLGGWLVWYVSQPEWKDLLAPCVIVGALIGLLVILIDVLLKGFSLRGMTAMTFGLAIGALFAHLLLISPLFDSGDPQTRFLARLVVFVSSMYLGTVIALRGRDEFNLVIPYVRFLPQDVASAIVVVDTSALIDGRIVGICQSRFLRGTLVVPRFVLEELQHVADSLEPHRQARGRKGLQVLNDLKRTPGLEIRIHESEVASQQAVDAKLIFVAQSLKGAILTTDYNLGQLAEFQGVPWLNIHALTKALRTELAIGEIFTIELVKAGKEPGQAVGFLADGSMVVVNNGQALLGQSVAVEAISILPSAGGKMVFARPVGSRGDAGKTAERSGSNG